MSSPAKERKPGLLASPKSPFWAKKKDPGTTNTMSTEQTQMDDKKKETKKAKAVKTLKTGVKVVSNAGDFIGRLGALIVMLVTTINTTTAMVTSFIEEVYWRGGLYAGLLAFVHLPVIIVMIWMLCKSRVQSIYRKIRPGKKEDEVVVISSTSSSDEEEGKEKKDDKKKEAKEEEKKKKKEEMTTEAMRRANRAQQINRAFEGGGAWP